MIDQKLVKYIQQALDSGHDVNSTRMALINHGFQPNVVDDAINYVRPQTQQKSKSDVTMTKINNPQYGGFWIRFSAMFWDSIILGIPAYFIQTLVVLLTGIPSMTYLVTFAVIVVTVYMEGIKGGTPGKLILGLRIRNEKSEFIGIPLAILRYIGKILSGIILGIGYLMIVWDKRKQGLHDKIAGTFVVKELNVERKGLVVTGIVLGLLFILIVPLTMIGSLAYFGVMSPSKFLPDKCIMEPAMACTDFITTADGTTEIVLENNLGIDISDVTVSIENPCNPRNTPIKNGQSLQFTCPGTSGKKGNAYSQSISVKYVKSDTGLSYTAYGTLTTKYT